jgi:hypothetical protein
VSETWFDQEPKPAARAEPVEGDAAMAKVKDHPLVPKLKALVEQISRSPDETARRAGLLFDLCLYTGEPEVDLDKLGMDFARIPKAGDGQVFNICYSLVNTVLNRVTSFRTRAQFLPNGGDHLAKKAAQDMTTMSDAWAEEVNYQDEAAFAFRDMLTGDAGVLKVYEEDDKVRLGRFPVWEFMVERADGYHREPECLYHVRRVPVALAVRNLGLSGPAELRAQSNWDYLGSNADTAGTVLVVEAWRRGPKGRHVQLVGDYLVLDEEWEHDGFPVVIERFDWQPTGFWGRGGIAQLRDIQLEANELAVTLRESHRLTSSQVWIMEENQAAPSQLNNAYVRRATYQSGGDPPQVINPAPVHGEIYQYVKLLEDQGYKTWGVNPQIAQGTKPTGANSAVAQREAVEIQTDRLALLSQKWERMRVEAAKWWWRLTRDMARRTGEKPKWRGIARGQWREMVFGELEQEFEITAYPSSIFGQSISGRFERASELIQQGWLTREEAMRSLDVPDLSPTIDIYLAYDYVMEKLVDDVLEKGMEGYQTPPPYVDRAKMFEYAKRRYALAFIGEGNYPKDNLKVLSKLIDAIEPKQPANQVTDIAQAAPPAAAPAPAAPVAAPPVIPGMPEGGLPPTGSLPQ